PRPPARAARRAQQQVRQVTRGATAPEHDRSATRLPAPARSAPAAAEHAGAVRLAGRPHRATPFLYADEEIAALFAAADTLRFPLRVATYRTLIGLLAVTGLRVGEAIRLDRGDLDLKHELLVVRNSKFGKSREVPLHPSTIRALRDYLHLRDP
ncbi:MAG TPA: tyrosine-type recombinase/integrase, partial [Gaiellaceae bacterium]|nr:tyrosine-type recombinase/integrase [Gaiellaceae bacterium]